MTLAELKTLVETMQNLPCVIDQLVEVQVRSLLDCHSVRYYSSKNVKMCTINVLSQCKCCLFPALIFKAVLRTVEDFQGSAQKLLNDRDWKRDSPPEQLQTMIEQGAKLPVVVPECNLLQGLKEQGHWLAEVRRTLGTEGGERQEVTLDVLRNLMEAGCSVPQSISVETAMAELQELLTIAERWEEKAQICLEQRSAMWKFAWNYTHGCHHFATSLSSIKDVGNVMVLF